MPTPLDLSHLDSIEQRLAFAKARVGTGKGRQAVRQNEWFAHEVRMIEREREAELKFLGITERPMADLDAILDDLDALNAPQGVAEPTEESAAVITPQTHGMVTWRTNGGLQVVGPLSVFEGQTLVLQELRPAGYRDAALRPLTAEEAERFEKARRLLVEIVEAEKALKIKHRAEGAAWAIANPRKASTEAHCPYDGLTVSSWLEGAEEARRSRAGSA